MPGHGCLGFDMNQNRLAVPVWDYAFSLHPPARVIELGSYNGGFAMTLAFALLARGGSVYSFDTMEAPKEEWRPIAKVLPVHFLRYDIWELADLIGRQIADGGTTILLCDGGDKRREFNHFAKFLKAGDVIAAHDFQTPHWPGGSEITEQDVQMTVARYGLERWLPAQMNLCGWLAYRKA